MSSRGTCLITYLPMRSEPRPGAEMVNSIIFGESYTIIEEQEKWLKVVTDFDQYTGWINRAAYSEEQKFTEINDALYLDCVDNMRHLFVPCGANIPSENEVEIRGLQYHINRKLKTNHHLPLRIRIQKTAQFFLNTPYLWGGRTFMGIDCSGFTQIVYKANGYSLPRDTSQQILVGKEVSYENRQSCDLVFFSALDADHVSHVGLITDSGEVIHAGCVVRYNELTTEGLIVDGKLAYRLIGIRRILE